MRVALVVNEESLNAAMRNLPLFISEEIENLSRRILEQYRSSIPVYTRTLSDSVATRLSGAVEVEGVEVPTEIHITGAKHGLYLEHGTGPYAHRKRYNPPFERIRDWARFRGLNPGAVYNTIRRKGTRPYHYAREAIIRAVSGKWVISEL